jgi:hypothetical protein
MSNLDKLIDSELYQNTLSEQDRKETEGNFCAFLDVLKEIADANPQVINQKENVNDVLYENNGSQN